MLSCNSVWRQSQGNFRCADKELLSSAHKLLSSAHELHRSARASSL